MVIVKARVRLLGASNGKPCSGADSGSFCVSNDERATSSPRFPSSSSLAGSPPLTIECLLQRGLSIIGPTSFVSLLGKASR